MIKILFTILILLTSFQTSSMMSMLKHRRGSFRVVPDPIVVIDASDAGNITIIAGKVSAWTDSVTSNSFVQAVVGQRPTYDATGLNGNPTVVFNAGNLLTDPSFLVDLTPNNWTYILVIQIVSTSGQPEILDNTSKMLTWFHRFNKYAFSSGGIKNSYNAPSVSVQILTFRFSQTENAEIYLGSPGVAQSTGVNTYSQVGIFGATDMGFNGVTPGNKLSELRIYEGALSIPHMNSIQAELATKWGL